MRILILLLAAAALAARTASGLDEYGAKGLFPAYDVNGHWLIYDKTAARGGSTSLQSGERFLLIGGAGAGVFSVARLSTAYGGACRNRKPERLRVAVLKGPRRATAQPILALKVPNDFSLQGSRAVHEELPNSVNEEIYKSLGPALNTATVAEAKSGAFRFKADDDGAAAFLADPQREKVLLKIDYAAKIAIAGLKNPLLLVTSAQISNAFLRCLRLADGAALIGDCVEMPNALMAETSLLRFVSYDAGGKGSPLLLAFTKNAPLWGHERWGFALTAAGARRLLRDAMDPRCREGF